MIRGLTPGLTPPLANLWEELVRIPLHAQLTAGEAEHAVSSVYEFYNASLILREPPAIHWAPPAVARPSPANASP